jgi:hypothetical protein
MAVVTPVAIRESKREGMNESFQSLLNEFILILFL